MASNQKLTPKDYCKKSPIHQIKKESKMDPDEKKPSLSLSKEEKAALKRKEEQDKFLKFIESAQDDSV